MRWLVSISVLFYLLGAALAAGNSTSNSRHRDKKLLSLFQVVRFPNDACSSDASLTGTCYTEQECEELGGDSDGSCAEGFGVCCTFAHNCGATSRQNCTYFVSEGDEVGECALQICKCDSNICQLRLDFSTFAITGPSTLTDSAGKFNNNDIASETQCLTDTFSVTNPNGITPPTICGINANEHMYVDASDACNDLVFQLGADGIGADVAGRQWNIKITQYSCDYDNLAPEGCTQYHFGPDAGSIQTYNFEGDHHLASQNQNICIRRERGQCRICYFTEGGDDFGTSGVTATKGFAVQSSCCGYGAKGTGTLYDCVIIPGALTAANMKASAPSHFCGATLVTDKAAAGSDVFKTVCTDRVPFQVRFLSDNFEFAGAAVEALIKQVGFMLQYEMTSDGCS